jgi:rubrerythrin
MEKEAEPNILELLIRHELALKRLYETFASVFTDRQKFWQGIARDEQRHADWFNALRSEPATETWFLHDAQLKPQPIALSIGYVENLTHRARDGKIRLLEALSIARDLETALIEKQFSKMSASAPQDVRSILIDLAAETDRHGKVIMEIFTSEKR